MGHAAVAGPGDHELGLAALQGYPLLRLSTAGAPSTSWYVNACLLCVLGVGCQDLTRPGIACK